MRPLPEDHRQFNGQQPDHTELVDRQQSYKPASIRCWTRELTGHVSWDVDNDGDGVPDSVWVDLGMPVRTTADGRLYKPLFAILCVDLDGRLNLNAHGSLQQADTSNYRTLLTPPSRLRRRRKRRRLPAARCPRPAGKVLARPRSTSPRCWAVRISKFSAPTRRRQAATRAAMERIASPAAARAAT